jgi:hypothetical protein
VDRSILIVAHLLDTTDLLRPVLPLFHLLAGLHNLKTEQGRTHKKVT